MSTFTDKKAFDSPMPAKYDPAFVESGWDLWWQSKGFYKPAEIGRKAKDCFSMIIPPPNVTGKLHIGHALMCTIEDTLVRWHRMSQRPTLWVPGTDHAGIATQNVVERQLLEKEGKSRFDLGREEFERRVWAWKDEYGGNICRQIRRLGSSVDWDRVYFTLDDNLSKAVKTAFIELYKKNKIYRAKRFVNWSCKLATAISDCEVDKVEVPVRTLFGVPGHSKKVEFGVIHKFSYKFVDSDEEILIETTRPETMLGDVAVAVHPNDTRYASKIGKLLKHPFLDRRLPLIADAVLVDMDKGTGVVKITPAHDESDFNCGLRHGLESVAVFTSDGRINANGGAYEGMMRFDCRFAIIRDLASIGQYHGKRDFPMVVCKCSRSGDIIEPINTSQWWVNCEEVAQKSVDAVKSGLLEITPKREEKTFFAFLENIRPWCVSRQLWWGHRIPAYFPVVRGAALDRDDGAHWIVAKDYDEALIEAKERFGENLVEVEQDEDVLDTWFSSALLPFSVFGWPEKTEELDRFFPNSILETGSDILFFWVARMVFMSLELVGKLPFKKILLHPIVRAADGSKMSKSKGNIIDPLEVIDGVDLQSLLKTLDESQLPTKQKEKYKNLKRKEFPNGIPPCGADALRFGLLCTLNSGSSINLDISRVNGYRLFCNKIWQTANFAFPKLKTHLAQITTLFPLTNAHLSQSLYSRPDLSFADKWVLGRLNAAERCIDRAFVSFELFSGALCAYDFWLKDLCDVYLELVKPLFHLPASSGGSHKMASAAEGEQVGEAEMAARGTEVAGDEVAEGRETAKREMAAKVLFVVLHRSLRLFHPFMPFISEELYQRLPGRDGGGGGEESVMVAEYPFPIAESLFDKLTEPMGRALAIVRVVRSARMTNELANKPIPSAFICSDDAALSHSDDIAAIVSTLCNIDRVIIVLGPEHKVNISESLKLCSDDVVDGSLSVHLDIGKLINVSEQLAKLAKKKAVLEKQLAKLRGQLNGGRDKVPASVWEMEEERERLKSAEMSKLDEAVKRLERMKRD